MTYGEPTGFLENGGGDDVVQGIIADANRPDQRPLRRRKPGGIHFFSQKKPDSPRMDLTTQQTGRSARFPPLPRPLSPERIALGCVGPGHFREHLANDDRAHAPPLSGHLEEHTPKTAAWISWIGSLHRGKLRSLPLGAKEIATRQVLGWLVGDVSSRPSRHHHPSLTPITPLSLTFSLVRAARFTTFQPLPPPPPSKLN